MLHFNHQVACRNCMRTTGINNVYRLRSEDQAKYQNKSEYELMLLLEKWRIEDGHCCPFCGSSNLDIFDIDVDDYQFYNFDRLLGECQENSFCTLSLDMNKINGEINMGLNSSPNMKWSFLALSFSKINETIDSRDFSSFKSYPNGNFFINILSGPVDSPLTAEFTVQKLSYAGLSKEEILTTIRLYKNKVGML